MRAFPVTQNTRIYIWSKAHSTVSHWQSLLITEQNIHSLPQSIDEVESYDDVQLQNERLKRDQQSSELSTLMLQGWKMLADHCPVTGVPLMQARGETRRYSVGTKKYYKHWCLSEL